MDIKSTQRLLRTHALTLAFAAPLVATAEPSSARYVCKDFLERSGYVARSWGPWHTWTTIDNKDGTWSVGAKFVGMPPGGQERSLYVTCVMRKQGDNWSLVKLSRMY